MEMAFSMNFNEQLFPAIDETDYFNERKRSYNSKANENYVYSTDSSDYSDSNDMKRSRSQPYDSIDDESSIDGIIEEYFTTTDDDSISITNSIGENSIRSNDDSVYTEPLNTSNFEIQKALRCPNHHGKIAIPWNVNSNIVAKLDDIIAVRHDRMMVVTATTPHYVEWCNAGWSQFCGWSSEEITGLTLGFLQGSGTDKRVLDAFMNMLESSGGFADMTIINYNKYHVVMRNTIHCFPISDNCGFSNDSNITHIGVVLLDSQEVKNPSICDDLIRRNPSMHFDRRCQSVMYPLVASIPAPAHLDWMNLSKDFTMALMLRYMLRSQAPIMLTDR
jgi:hypothetical protein